MIGSQEACWDRLRMNLGEWWRSIRNQNSYNFAQKLHFNSCRHRGYWDAKDDSQVARPLPRRVFRCAYCPNFSFQGDSRCRTIPMVRLRNQSSENKPMIRKAFVMSVNSGSEEEYVRRHSPIWPELERVLKHHGAHNYSIFLHPGTRQLFGYVEVEDERTWSQIASTPECTKWWASMKTLMPSNPDNSPVSRDLREVFHLE
jgi:L-rhamnose mutarotase